MINAAAPEAVAPLPAARPAVQAGHQPAPQEVDLDAPVTTTRRELMEFQRAIMQQQAAANRRPVVAPEPAPVGHDEITVTPSPAPAPTETHQEPAPAPLAPEKKPVKPEKAGVKTAETSAGLTEWINNGIGNFLWGVSRNRLPIFRGAVNAGGVLTLAMIAKGLTVASLFTPAGLPILGLSAVAGLGGWGLSYLFEKRHKGFKTKMPGKEGDKIVNVSFVEWINNALGNFFLGKNRQRAPILKGAVGTAMGALTGALSLPFLGPVAPAVGIAVGAGIGGAGLATDSFIWDVRRKAFPTKYPTL